VVKKVPFAMLTVATEFVGETFVSIEAMLLVCLSQKSDILVA